MTIESIIPAGYSPLTFYAVLVSQMVCCFVLPFFLVRALVPSLRKGSARVTNFAGHPVVYGLGFAWVFAGLSLSIISSALGIPFVFLGTTAIIGVFIFGFIDDVYGTSESRGFKGHLKALGQGELTTGGLKLFGISLIALFSAGSLFVSRFNFLGAGVLASYSTVKLIGIITAIFLGGATIALTANFLNLCDLRPGRASKVYLILLAIALIVNLFVYYVARPYGYQGNIASMLLPYLGAILPLLAVIVLDLKEVGMQGDAGANVMGYIAGFALVSAIASQGRLYAILIALTVIFALVLALNLASEKVSFSNVIENNSLLKFCDDIGRLKHSENTTGKSEETEEKS